MKFDIVIVAGQSNAEGNGRGGEPMAVPEGAYQLREIRPARPEEAPLVPGAVPAGTVRERLAERGPEGDRLADLSPAFAEEYIRAGLLAPGRGLLVVKTAVGGTGFARKQWGVGYPLSDRCVALVEEALATDPESRIVALLWHQGEHDAFEQAELTDAQRYDFYRDAFGKQVRMWRERWGEMPLVCGGFAAGWAAGYRAQCDAVEQALRDECDALGRAAYVAAADLPTNSDAVGSGDNIHFCRAGVYELGRRYFRAFRALG